MKRREFTIGLCATGLAGPAWANEGGGDQFRRFGKVYIRLTPQITRYRIKSVVFTVENRIGIRYELGGSYRQSTDNRLVLPWMTKPSLLDQALGSNFLARVYVDDHVLYAQTPRMIQPEIHNLLIGDGRVAFNIGGMTKLKHREVNRVPLLGDLPAVGGLFRSSGGSHGKDNLIIMITPRVLEAN